MHAKSLWSCLTLETLWTAAHQDPLSMLFSRQEYWSGLPCSPPGNLPNPGIEPTSLMSPALAGRFFTTSITWEAHVCPKPAHLFLGSARPFILHLVRVMREGLCGLLSSGGRPGQEFWLLGSGLLGLELRAPLYHCSRVRPWGTSGLI